jgi:uncharacterized membrane-anchored protein YjiN (DUF445 family)
VQHAAPPRRQRRLALAVLVIAAVTAVVAYPVRSTWWGGWVLAIAEAGLVGGLADWFAVTAIFRRPLGLPIPHTALIPANWELMATRMGRMVGDRVLTKQFVTDELGRLDLGELLARAAARLTPGDLETATRAVAHWLVGQVPPHAIHDLLERVRQLLAARAWAPTVASVLDVARERGWDEHIVGAAFRALADALERPAMSAAVADLVDDLLQRYRQSLRGSPRFWLGVADFMGFIDRHRIVAALRSGAREIAEDPGHSVRRTVLGALADVPPRLRSDPALAARVEAVAHELLEGEPLRRLLGDVAELLQRSVLADLGRQRSELIAWAAERLERARRDVIADEDLRRDLDGWVKRRLADAIERHHGRIAEFIEKGVRALGAVGAVRLIEEHAGDDLQYIRVNGTVVGGLAGGALYAIHLLLRLLL